ncbi:Bax inhibitor-1/YccA family protein [Candidatus Gromoviella agglomerans]|uniref:Bax inhibitor-1/YccA family protein n=1 Tax=Candidatus Gromoviella agglomerans TaxID=2806609 RepID=UPI001E4469C9|nr:Bax inhibitor-1/YccA family protein [Candidatus Gromoviella agglomerans]UFX98320.1 Inner membrane protein YbhL [Candidatus Gromoviella agglomerans]
MQINYGQNPRMGYNMSVDVRSFLSRVFLFMSGGLALTGVLSLILSNMPHVMHAIFSTPLFFVFALAPLGVSMYISARFQSMSVYMLQNLFWLYCMLMAVSMSSVFLLYTGESIARTFFVTSGVFLSAAIYGRSTKKDLSYMGMFMFMGVVGIMIASVLNIFIKSSSLDFVISLIGVVVFTALTAYNIQNLISIHSHYSMNGESLNKIAIIGSLSLYVNFVNLFVFMLRFFGNRRND